MKLKISAFAAASVVIGLGLAACNRTVNTPPQPTPGPKPPPPIIAVRDSPVTVGGGSIYARVENPTNALWTRSNPNQPYSEQNTNNDFITTTALPGAPATLSGTGGWKIVFMNFDQNNQENRGPVTVCSDVNCMGTSLDSGGKVYLEGEGVWEELGNGAELRFHDHRPHCAVANTTATPKEGPCDHVAYVTITAVNNTAHTNGKRYQCPGQVCSVTIGTPATTPN